MVRLYLFIIYFHFHSFCHKLQHTEKVHNESSKERKKERKKEAIDIWTPTNLQSAI